MTRKFGWQALLWPSMLVLALVLLIRSDLTHLDWVSTLSSEGSPPPQRDPNSPTGYVLGQRYFLGTHERGETYRWIAATQELIASGLFAAPAYHADNAPGGRAQLLPRLYGVWLATLSWGVHFVTGEPLALSVERAALWEPVISHVLAFIAAVAFMWVRYGAASAGVTGLFFALYPPIFGQFLPGVLTAKTWSLLLAAYAIALNLPGNDDKRKSLALSARSALAASLALWLDPAFGFPAVLVSAAASAGSILRQKAPLPCLKWALIGSGVTLTAWLVDQAPWDPAAGELRYVHPMYALAWLGIGLALDCGQNWRTTERRRRWHMAEIAAALSLLSPLVYTQLHGSYRGWIYSSASMRRLTSLDETSAYNTAVDWLTHASFGEVAFVSAPALFALVALAASLWRKQDAKSDPPSLRAVVALLFAALLTLAFFRIRWGVIAALVSLPLIWNFAAPAAVAYRRGLLAIAAAFLLGLFAWGRVLPASLQRPTRSTPASPADLEALIYRHFSRWLAVHNPGQNVTALAPPELSDSLVFHGGCRVLVSTAWEAYSGLVAASRILSAPESSEAEAVLQSREITHVILPSWDKVLPLIVRKPEAEGKDTLYARLQRWVHPRYLRAIPYRLPPVPGYLDQKLVVFKVTPPQDEALSLSRLAGYFVEMDREVPAGLTAVLADSFPDDPNAAIARALVYAQAKNQAGFERELERLTADVTAGRSPSSWDGRVQRAIVFTLGRREELARAEVEACLDTATKDDLFDLTPLQAYRLRTLASRFHLAFADARLTSLLATLGAEFSSPSTNPANR